MIRVCWVAGLALAIMPACAALESVDLEQCGNAVLETGEDCDFFGEGAQACGAPSTANACFFTCSAEGAGCPSGFGCGADGRCRSASGTFQELSPVAFPVPRFDIGDVDGDGAPDVVATTQNRLFVGFGGADGAIETVSDVATNAPRPFLSLADLNVDGRVDIVSPTIGGLSLYLGAADRSLQAEAFPTFTFPTQDVVHVGLGALITPEGFEAAEVVSLRLAGNNAFIGIGEAADTSLGSLLGVGAIPEAAVRAPLAIGNVDIDPSHEMAFTFDGATKVWVLSLTAEVGIPSATIHQAIDLPAQRVARGRPFLSDLDENGALDVIVMLLTPPGAPAEFVFIQNLGNGNFAAPFVAPMPFVSESAEILALAQLDDRAGLDFITTEAAFGDGFFVVGNWLSAASIDLNGDGELDFVAVPTSAPGVEVHTKIAGLNQFNRLVVGTSSFANGTGDIGVGDFDGDAISDVTLTAPSTTGQTDVRVLYGQATGGFDEPEVKAHYDSIAQTVVLPPEFGNINSVLVSERALDPAQYELSILRGDPSRSLLAPLLLLDVKAGVVDGELEPVFHLPTAAVAARPKGEEHIGVFSTTIGIGDPFNSGPFPDKCGDANNSTECTYAWGIPGDGTGALLRDSESRSLIELGLTPAQLDCREARAADIKGEGHDQFILWVARPDCGGNDVGADRLRVVDLGVDDQAIAVGNQVGRIVDLISADFDGDGEVEIAISYIARGAAGIDASGGIAIFRPTIPGSMTETIELPSFRPGALSTLDLNSDGVLELAVSGSVGTENAEPALWLMSWDDSISAFSAPLPNDQLSVGFFARSADMNQDGLADLIIGNEITITVMLAIPAEPLGSAEPPPETMEGEGS